MNLIIFLSASTVFLLGVELTKRKLSLSPNYTRRVSHTGAALIAAVSPYFIDKKIIVFACLGFALVMFLSRKASFFSSIHAVKRNTFGEVFLPLGEAFSAAIFLPQAIIAFQYGILVTGLSDAFAGFVGEKYGRHEINIFNNKKSLEGSLAFFLTTIFITFLIAPILGFHLVLIPLALTLIELLLGYGMDNLAIPIIGSFLFLFVKNTV